MSSWASAQAVGGAIHVVDEMRPARSCAEPFDISVHRLDDALREVITDHLAGARQPAVLCSGGLDSAVVAAIAREVMGAPPILITVKGGLLSNPEIRLVESVTRSIKGERIVVEDDLGFGWEDLLTLNEGASWPSGGVFTGVWRRVADRCAERGIDLVLTGEGGNEVCSTDGMEVLDLLAERRPFEAMRCLGRARGADSSSALAFLREGWRTRFLPGRYFGPPDCPPSSWYGAWTDHFPESLRRWRRRLQDLTRAGFTWCEALARVRLDGLGTYAPADPLKRIAFRHPLSDDRFRSAFFSAPLENRVGVSVGKSHKHLLRVLGRRWLPAEVTEQRKIGPANQISVLTAAPRDRTSRFSTEAAEWLGLRLGAEFQRPWESPANFGLHWTQLQAILAWAANRNART